ncbi:lectin subunit alpha-like [Calliphora vicina]|uniref:lectin subunit alpha-like n=1 Tax=Calliphora vicina TaxID=7373 RepID=UPI00325A7786
MGQLYTSDANNTYYIDFERKFSWFDGQIACLRMNMTLVEIKTSTKSLELNTMIKNLQQQNNIKGDYLWIGGILSRFPNKKFVWLSTGEELTYTNWYDNNPDFYNDNEFCIEMVMAENWKWNDDSCITRGGFVCEYKKEIEIQQEIYNHLQEQNNLQQEVVKQKEQIENELQKQNDLQHKHLEKLQQFEEQKLEMEKEIAKYLRKMNQSLETQEKLKENLQTEVKNNEALNTDLRKQKQLQQQLQEKLALREEELGKQQALQQQLKLQLQDLKEEKLQLKNQLETELSPQKDLNQEMLENEAENHKRLFQISHLKNHINELLQSSDDNNWESKDLQKYELHNNGQNVVIVYSPYRVFFNNIYQNLDNSTTHN